MAIALDGTAIATTNGALTAGTSFPLPSFTNSSNNCIIIVVFASEGANTGTTSSIGAQPTVSSVSDNSGQALTWHKLANIGGAADELPPAPSSTSYVSYDLAVWWTIAPLPFSGVTITVDTAANVGDMAEALMFACSGVNIASPWDSDSPFSVWSGSSSATTSTPSISGINTSESAGRLLVFGAGPRDNNHQGFATAGSGFTEITSGCNYANLYNVSAGAEYQDFTSALSGASASFNQSSFPIYWWGMIAAALTPALAAPWGFAAGDQTGARRGRRSAVFLRSNAGLDLPFRPSPVAGWSLPPSDLRPRREVLPADGSPQVVTLRSLPVWGHDCVRPDLPGRPRHSPERGDPGIAAPFAAFVPRSEIRLPDLGRLPRRNPDRGTEAAAWPAILPILPERGHEGFPAVIRARPRRSADQGDGGIEAPLRPPPFPAWGYDAGPTALRFLRHAVEGGASPFVPALTAFAAFAWAAPQDLRQRERAACGCTDAPAVLALALPAFRTDLLPDLRRRRAAAPETGDAGIAGLLWPLAAGWQAAFTDLPGRAKRSPDADDAGTPHVRPAVPLPEWGHGFTAADLRRVLRRRPDDPAALVFPLALPAWWEASRDALRGRPPRFIAGATPPLPAELPPWAPFGHADAVRLVRRRADTGDAGIEAIYFWPLPPTAARAWEFNLTLHPPHRRQFAPRLFAATVGGHFDPLLWTPLLLFDPRFRSTPAYGRTFVARTLRTVVTAGALRRAITSSPRRDTVTAPPRRSFITATLSPTMPQGPDFSAIDTGEVISGTFDFGPWLPNAGQAIASVQTVTCTVVSGTDAAPASRLIGIAQINPSPSTGLASQAVLQQWGTMLDGVTYRLQATVVTTDNQILTLWAHQECSAPD